MTPKGMMIMGSMTGFIGAALCVVGAVPSSGTLVFMFAAGMAFGKGYGIWEERSTKGEVK